jgi:hypothetical protein
MDISSPIRERTSGKIQALPQHGHPCWFSSFGLKGVFFFALAVAKAASETSPLRYRSRSVPPRTGKQIRTTCEFLFHVFYGGSLRESNRSNV